MRLVPARRDTKLAQARSVSFKSQENKTSERRRRVCCASWAELFANSDGGIRLLKRTRSAKKQAKQQPSQYYFGRLCRSGCRAGTRGTRKQTSYHKGHRQADLPSPFARSHCRCLDQHEWLHHQARTPARAPIGSRDCRCGWCLSLATE